LITSALSTDSLTPSKIPDRTRSFVNSESESFFSNPRNP
jgi:hypothetical protein